MQHMKDLCLQWLSVSSGGPRETRVRTRERQIKRGSILHYLKKVDYVTFRHLNHELLALRLVECRTSVETFHKGEKLHLIK
jgi:hypothetical protein